MRLIRKRNGCYDDEVILYQNRLSLRRGIMRGSLLRGADIVGD